MKQRAYRNCVATSLLLILTLLPIPVQTQDRGFGLNQQRLEATNYHALVIGNNAYTSLPRLKTAEADARQVAALLKDNYGFETRLLLNATRSQIMSALSAYRRTLGPEAHLLIYYAGHGVNDVDADKAYWLPVDATRDDTSNWIIADDITTAIKVVPARHVLVVSDSCYSGTLTHRLVDALPSPSEREQFIKRMMTGRSRRLMASGGNEPVADGGGGNHSVFAAALLRGLREMDKPRFTGNELFRSYVEEAVAGRAEQIPEYSVLRNSGHESGDFVFVRVELVKKAVALTTGKTSDPNTAELSDAVKAKAKELVTRSQKAFNSKRYDEAIQLSTEAIKLDSQDADAYSSRAAAHFGKGEYDVTIRDATEAIRLDSQHAEALSNRAAAYERKAEYDATIRDTTEAIRLDPKYARAHSNRAAAYFGKGEYDAAIRDATEAIRLDPQHANAYDNRGAAYEKLGIKDLAIADREKATELRSRR